MQAYKREFIEFLVRCEALRFGDFTTKSGRETPYFVDLGRFRTGEQLARLGGFYAAAIQERVGDGFDVLFGPAYKGIPLVAATAIALAAAGRNVGWCFDRKERKDHGEGGILVGHELRDGDRVLVVEDVTTAGTSVRQTVPLLLATAAVELVGLVVAVDRLERGTGDRSALQELHEEYAMPCFAIVDVTEVIEHLHGRELDGGIVLDDARRRAMEAYLERWAPR